MQSGDNIGKYQLVTRLGRGGMGEVWLAMALGYGGFAKPVVLKTLLPEFETDPLYIEMLAHEARTCAKLNHPNLIEVFDFSKYRETYLLAMEHVLGESLSAILRMSHARQWPIPAWFALRVAWECCRGLDHAHEQGVIHCDLSPSNVMVTFTGVTKILDFGVAHSAEDGDKADRLKGKWSYMAPERLRSLATDRRTDVYALGVMLYLLFVGRLPYEAANDEELVRMKLLPPARPSRFGAIDETIEMIIMRCLEPDPEARFQTAHDVLEALSPSLDGSLGAYGQHDAAAFMKRLFDDRTRPAMPTKRSPALIIPDDEVSPAFRALTAQHEGGALDIDVELDVDVNFDIEVVSDIVELVDLSARPATVPAHGKALGQAARALQPQFPEMPAIPELPRPPRASISMPPLARPALPALMPEGSSTDDYGESKTTVQSLFGATRRPPPVESNTIFGAPRPANDRATTSDGSTWPWAASRVKSS